MIDTLGLCEAMASKCARGEQQTKQSERMRDSKEGLKASVRGSKCCGCLTSEARNVRDAG